MQHVTFKSTKKSDFKTSRSGYGHEWIPPNLAFNLLSRRSKEANLQAVKCQSYCCHMLNEGVIYFTMRQMVGEPQCCNVKVNCFTF
jgi:hypothetical protein